MITATKLYVGIFIKKKISSNTDLYSKFLKLSLNRSHVQLK